MKRILYFILVIPFIGLSQQHEVEQDTLTYEYYYIKGDSIPKTMIDLDYS